MWSIAIGRCLVCAEAAVHCRKAANTAIIDTLYGSHPEVDIGDNGVLDDDGGIDTPKSIC